MHVFSKMKASGFLRTKHPGQGLRSPRNLGTKNPWTAPGFLGTEHPPPCLSSVSSSSSSRLKVARTPARAKFLCAFQKLLLLWALQWHREGDVQSEHCVRKHKKKGKSCWILMFSPQHWVRGYNSFILLAPINILAGNNLISWQSLQKIYLLIRSHCWALHRHPQGWKLGTEPCLCMFTPTLLTVQSLLEFTTGPSK